MNTDYTSVSSTNEHEWTRMKSTLIREDSCAFVDKTSVSICVHLWRQFFLYLRSPAFICGFILCGLLVSVARAEAPATRPASRPAGNIVETSHELAVGEVRLEYLARAGTIALVDDAGKKRADVFFVAYEKAVEDAERRGRPITFVFNGGPGAAAVWLHLGTAGPRVIDIPPDGQAPAPPYRLIDNDATWLTETDLVFIDPVGTGFSRVAEGVKGDQFYGLREDIAAVGEFIRLYTTRYERHLSPLFLAGESYGTTRAAGLAEHLLEEEGIALSGIILISSVLDFATLRAGDGNDLPYVLFLPSYVAVAHYHGRFAGTDDAETGLEQLLDKAEDEAISFYLPNLARGRSIDAAQRVNVIEWLARWTKLDAATIDSADLRIDPSVFMSRLLTKDRLLIGRFDGRLSAFDPSPLFPVPEHDPSLSRFLPAYTSTFVDYVRRSLGYETDLKYEVLSGRVHPWNFGEAGQGYVSTADDLASAMRQNPALKVLFASGLHDLATPYFATDYTIAHLDLSDALRQNITHRTYPGGHMMYHVEASRRALAQDIARFIRQSVPPRP
jgi:carboxypeptidase C (cathepsin A)